MTIGVSSVGDNDVGRNWFKQGKDATLVLYLVTSSCDINLFLHEIIMKC